MKAWALSTHILPGARHLAPCPARPHQSHPQRRPPSGLTSSPSAHPTARRRLLTSPLPLRSGHQPSLPATAGASPPASLSASVSPTVWPQYSPKPSQVTLLRTPHPRRRSAPSEPSSPKPSSTPTQPAFSCPHPPRSTPTSRASQFPTGQPHPFLHLLLGTSAASRQEFG